MQIKITFKLLGSPKTHFINGPTFWNTGKKDSIASKYPTLIIIITTIITVGLGRLKVEGTPAK